MCNAFNCDDDFTNLMLELTDVWDAEAVTDEVEQPGAVAQCMFNEHGMQGVSEITENGQCRAWKINWLQDCDYDGVSKVADFSDTDCDFEATPVGLECGEEEYERNCFMKDKGRSFTDQACTSKYMGVNFAANRIMSGIKAMRKAIATDALAFYTANAEAISWTGTYGNVVGNQLQFTSAEFNMNLLYHLTNIARHEKCTNYKLIDDTNFFELYLQSMDGQCCKDGSARNAFSRYNLSFDTWLDEALGRRSTLMFNPNNFGFINTNRAVSSTPTQTLMDGQNSVWEWYVDDPEWTIADIDNEGRRTIRPVRYDVEYSKTCCGKDKLGKRLYKHVFVVSFMGGRWVSPTGCNDSRCIYEIVNIG